MEHKITISDGEGLINLFDGNYNVSSGTRGYENSTIRPVAIEVTSDKNEYDFTIAGSAMLMIYVYDGDTKIEGATFYRCTRDGTKYGDPVVTDSSGFAYLTNLPYTESGVSVTVYFVQTSSDGSHSFSEEIHNTHLTMITGNSFLIENPSIT